MKLAIIVGHSAKKPNFKNYLGETEYGFNYRIADKLKIHLDKEYKCITKIFYRDGTTLSGVGDEVEDWHADASIELHCNAFKEPLTHGKVCEALALKGDEVSIEFAKLFASLMRDYFGFGLRHDNGCKIVKYGERGAYNLAAINLDIPKILVEPCFTNFETDEAVRFHTNEDLYIAVLAESFRLTMGLERKMQDVPEVPIDNQAIKDMVYTMEQIRDLCDNFIEKYSIED